MDKSHLQLTHQQIGQVIAVTLITCFFIFIAGYYWGKKSALELYAARLESDSLADKVSYAFFSLYDAQDDDEEADSQDEAKNDMLLPSVSQDAVSQDASSGAELPDAPTADEKKQIKDTRAHDTYHAQLAGFGTLKAAQAMKNKLDSKGFPVEIVTRTSKSSKGRQIEWYQVVTQQYESRDDVEKMIVPIKEMCKLKDVQIVARTTAERLEA